MFPPPSPAGGSTGGRVAHKSKGGDMWGQAAENWGNKRRTPGQGQGGQLNFNLFEILSIMSLIKMTFNFQKFAQFRLQFHTSL